jgi:phosphoribosylcarboxyaminoimidazole (NCAIR) mutase
MGLVGPGFPEPGRKPRIGILKPAGIRLPEKSFREALALLEQFGIAFAELEAPAAGGVRIRERVRGIEGEGGGAIIALGDWSDDLRRIDFPGRVAGLTDLPVIGVPVMEQKLGPRGDPGENPLCALLCSYDGAGNASGYPVAGMGINRFKNAAIYAAQILGIHHPDIRQAVRSHRNRMAAETEKKNERLGELGVKSYLAQDRR